MQEITQIISFKNEQFFEIKNLKENAYEILKKLNLVNSQKAAGVMYLKKQNKKLFLYPVVWVKNIKTLVYETACGSGTTAVGIYLADKYKRSINQDIIQPSGHTIKVDIKYKNNKVEKARIFGQTTNLGTTTIEI